MAGKKPTVVVDVSPLRTPHRLRGIGRYVHDLLHGLEETRASWADDLRIVAIGMIPPAGPLDVSEDLRAVADRALAAPGIARQALARRRRAFLGMAAARVGADLIHETETMGTPLASRVPRVVTCYDLIPLRFPAEYTSGTLGYHLERLRALRRYRLARRVVALSRRTRDDLIELLHVPGDKIDVAQTGIDLSFWTPAEEAPSSAEPYVVYVGGHDYRKNIAGMMQALAEARRTVPVRLVWPGALSEASVVEMKSLAARAGVEGAVEFRGFVDDTTLRSLYRESAGQLFLSRLEGFGLPVAEAMAVGCPSIVSRGSGVDELVADAGIVVDADDARGAGAAIARLVSEPGLRARLTASGKTRVAVFSRAEMARGYVEAYRRAL